MRELVVRDLCNKDGPSGPSISFRRVYRRLDTLLYTLPYTLKKPIGGRFGASRSPVGQVACASGALQASSSGGRLTTSSIAASRICRLPDCRKFCRFGDQDLSGS